jgi:hypothetical protein
MKEVGRLPSLILKTSAQDGRKRLHNPEEGAKQNTAQENAPESCNGIIISSQ